MRTSSSARRRAARWTALGPVSTLRRWLLRVDGPLYVLVAAICTIASARVFYGYMLRQTGGEWSAPLDDVFIHFDYARATAQGYPFEWSVGNGYSSGNTSLTYPFVLAIGWIAGFRELDLMRWAAVIAMVSVFGTLLAARQLFLRIAERRAERGAMRALSFLLPPVVLGVGVLAWSLWSGMEVAFFLGVWSCALLAFFSLEDAGPEERSRRALALGLWGALLVATRPEATTTIAALGMVAAAQGRRSLGERAGMLLRVGAPALVLLALQAFANKQLTGESSANGAIVKLAVNSPFLTPAEKLADYTFNLQWTALRNLAYHFTDKPYFGFIFPALGVFALAVPATRRYAVLLWLQILGWIALVALNGQVRWQNDRYTQPAVAWLLILGALGTAALLRRSGRPKLVATVAAGTALVGLIVLAMRRAGMTSEEPRLLWLYAIGGAVLAWGALRYWPARAVAISLALYLAHDHQIAKMRDQKWFFGRASRNILDQHVVTGRKLATMRPKRVLVGDAGALMYASERPGLDIIGLGGYHDLPFARASVHGLAAVIELIERMPKADRPDMMAIYPTWWGVLPTWFAEEELFRTPAEGNVICGGYEDVVYTTDWHVLGTGEASRSPFTGRIVDVLDVADLVSEKEHDYAFDQPGNGWTDMKILEDPFDHLLDMFDGGRRIGGGRGERYRLHHLRPGVPAQLIVRSAPDAASHVRFLVGGQPAGAVDFAHADGWVEQSIELPGDRVTETLDVRVENDGGGDFVDYHVWIAQ